MRYSRKNWYLIKKMRNLKQRGVLKQEKSKPCASPISFKDKVEATIKRDEEYLSK